MPMRWTPEKDQLLLLKILETHNLSVDTKKVAEAWPSNEEKPTARAITERLVKMRAIVKANASASGGGGTPDEKGGHFSIGKGIGSGRSSVPSTPRGSAAKPRARTQTTCSTPSSAKRKRVAKNVDSETESEEEAPAKIKSEMNVDEDSDADGEFEPEDMYTPPMKTEEKEVARVLFPNAMKAAPASRPGSGSGSAGLGNEDGTSPAALAAPTSFGSTPAVRAGSTLKLVVGHMKREPRTPRARLW
ncbi:hypothetical protein BJY01DRAFT_244501 [Aspergillus pseudoustus]|uniref:Uncharacterized protein n=1 Tax=Aspergillus pseudoustus TaxID=1810923 RepID=A0ABR4KJN7_9EURO